MDQATKKGLVRVRVDISPEDRDRLNLVAAQNGYTSMSTFVKRLIADAIKPTKKSDEGG